MLLSALPALDASLHESGDIHLHTGQLAQDSTWRRTSTGATQMTILNSFWSFSVGVNVLNVRVYVY